MYNFLLGVLQAFYQIRQSCHGHSVSSQCLSALQALCSVRGSGLCVPSPLPGCGSTRGGWAGVGTGVGGCRVPGHGSSSWLLWALSPACSAHFKQLLHLSKSSLGDWPGKEQQRIKRLHFQTTSQPPARNWTFFCSLDALHSLASHTFFWLAHCQCCALSSSAASFLHKELWFWSLSNEPFEVKMSVRAW